MRLLTTLIVCALPAAALADAPRLSEAACAVAEASMNDSRYRSVGAGFDRVVLAEDLRRTGEVNLAAALRKARSTSRHELERRARRDCGDAAS